MLEKLSGLSALIGHTPLARLKLSGMDLFAKLEYNNFSGSIKDRAAYNMIYEAIKAGKITEDTIIVESSSGNFAIALASLCRSIQLKFVAVVDPNVNKSSQSLLELLCHQVIKVTDRDATGGYLLTRLEAVKEFCRQKSNAFWPNQYENHNNYLSYYHGLGQEICDSFSDLDYAFIGVSTGGTITGLSLKLKEKFPGVRIIGVDVEGSVVFGGKPRKRFISGIGASITSPVLDKARIDEVMYISQLDIVQGCHELLAEQMIFGGASAGAVYVAIKKYFNAYRAPNTPKVVFLCPDKGNAYVDTIYDHEWLESLKLACKDMEPLYV